MSKILKNTTGSAIAIIDAGVTILASPGSYVIPAQDYLLWAASDNVITHIGSGNIIVNDGSVDLSISDGVDLIKGIFPKVIKIKGDTDDADIGNVNDNLKVIDEDAISVLNQIAIAAGAGAGLSILKQNEAAVSSRVKFNLANTTYTVPAGKTFLLTSFASSYDAQAAMYIRLEKQTGGVGSFSTLFRMTMMSGGQGESTESMNFGSGIKIGSAGDVFKITIEGSIAKGTVWAEYSGSEI